MMATQVEPIVWVRGRFSDDPVYDALGHRLVELLGAWLETKAKDIVDRYNIVLLALLELGFMEPLEPEFYLPDELMTAIYRKDGWHIRSTILEPIKEPQKS